VCCRSFLPLLFWLIDREKINQKMKYALYEAISISPVSRVVIIGVDVEQSDYPYSVLGYHLIEDENAF
jgi:hypothetical protein